MANQVATAVERRVLNYVRQKYPEKPINEIVKNTHRILTKNMRERIENEKKLFQVLSQVPNWGTGRLFVPIDKLGEKTFWRVTRVFVDSQDQELRHGLAWGIYTYKGRCEGFERQIVDVNENLWRIVPKYAEKSYIDYKPDSIELIEFPLYVPLPPLLSKMIKESRNKTLGDNKEPLMKLMFHRSPNFGERQRLSDGTLV